MNCSPVTVGVAFLVLVFAVFRLISFLKSRRVAKCLRAIPSAPSKGRRSGIVGKISSLLFGETFELFGAKPGPWTKLRRWSEQLSEVGRGGGLIKFSVLGHRVVYVTDPKVCRHILQKAERRYAKATQVNGQGGSKGNAAKKGFIPKILDSEATLCPLFDRDSQFLSALTTVDAPSLLSAHTDSTTWRQEKQQLVQGLQKLVDNETVPFITLGAVHRVVSLLRTAETLEAELDLAEVLSHVSLQLAAELTMGLEPGECDEVLPKLLLPVLRACEKEAWSMKAKILPKGWSSAGAGGVNGAKKRKKMKELDEALRAVIRVRWALMKAEAADDEEVQEQQVQRTAGGSARHQRRSRGEFGGSNSPNSSGLGSSLPGSDKTPDPREPDLLDAFLLNVKTMNREIESKVLGQLKVMLLQSYETMSSLLCWTFLEVLPKPEIVASLTREWEDVFGSLAHGEVPTMDMVEHLRWAPAVIKEAMRLHTPIPLISRVAVEDDRLPRMEGVSGDVDVVIPKGVTVVLGADAIHRRSENYPNPDDFVPQRFLDHEADVQAGAADPFAFLPFGAGPRACPGQQTAMLQATMMVSYIVTGMVDSTTDVDNSSLRPVFELASPKEKLSAVESHKFPLMPKHGLPIKPVKS